MKKLKLNMPLEKATRNRAHLVKVMTQVQGRTGQYQAHRWINPNKAMDILKDDLSKQGLKGVKSLEFEDPKTGKVLDEKQLLDQMEKEGFKGTLQEYAKQYKIKAKGSKKNIAAAKPKAEILKEVTKDDSRKPWKTLDNNQIELYESRNKKPYVKVIDSITPSGHLDTYFVNGRGGKFELEDGELYEIKEDGDIFYVEVNGSNVYKITKEEAIKRYEEKSKAVADNSNQEADETEQSNISVGSEKQKAWAENIWKDFRATTKETEKGMRDLANSDDKDIASFSNKFLDAYDEILNDPNSVNWIENYRGKGTYAILEKMYEDIATMPNLDAGVKFEKRKNKVSKALHEISNLLTNTSGNDPQTLEFIAKAGSLVEKVANSDDEDFYKRVFNTADWYLGMDDPKAGELFEAKNKLIAIKEELIASNYTNIFLTENLEKVTQYAYANEFLNNTKNFENSANIKGLSSDDKDKIMRFRSQVYCAIDTYKNSQEAFDKYYGKHINRDDIGTLEKAINFDNAILWESVLGNELDPYKNADTFVKFYEIIVKDLKDKEDKPINWGAMKRFGTKKILSNGLTQPLNSLSAVEEQAKAFKNEHTDIIARNTLDMLGLNIPLYVKRNGKTIQLGRMKVQGFCQYDKNGPMEISVVDYKDKKKSYEVTIHEAMHGLFAKTFNKEGQQLARVLRHEHHEGLVELIGQASVRKVYGEEANSLTPAYLSYVTKTALQLRKDGHFQGKGIYNIAAEIGEYAAHGNAERLFQIADSLRQTNKMTMEELTSDITNDIKENPDKLDDKAAKLNKEKNLGEPSELANLVEELKRGTISLSQALNSPQFGPLAALLILEFLEDDEDLDIPF